MAKNNFIVVSNRLPVTVSKKEGKLHFTPSPGGLATAMSSVEADDMLWVGWPGIESDELTSAEKNEIISELKKFNCAPVFLTASQVAEYYEGYSNETLWPLFHYFQSLVVYKEENWQTYKQVNELFAKEVLKHSSAQSTIWVHDYHLVLVPSLIRKELPESSIGYFLHIPFPSFEVFRLLPHRHEILEGLMGADLIGFHIYDYVRHFMSSVMRTLGIEAKNGSIMYEGRSVRTDAFPIGIDYEKFRDAAMSKEVAKEVKLLDQHYGKQKVLLSVDRLDYSKGIAKRLEAFEQFLKENPAKHKKITMVVIAVPSRTEVDAYKDLRDTIEQTVSRINGTYATTDWVPVAYQFQNLPFTKLVALYAKSDIALVTPIRDGMNLVAKEYVASKQKGLGVLILSEMAGAVDELPEALVVNPNDIGGIVRAIQDALKMTDYQQSSRLKTMQQRISSYDINRWANDFLEHLNVTKTQQQAYKAKLLNRSDYSAIAEAFKAAKNRLLILDYDGTLTPFVSSAKATAAVPSKKLIESLKSISRKSGCTIQIVSGRPKEALELWFGDMDVELVAEHGYWTKSHGKWQNHSLNTSDFKQMVMPLMIRYTERTPGAVLEDKSSSLVWHYRKVNPELAYVRRRNLRHELNERLVDSEASVYTGHKILEVKHKGINKGRIVRQLIENNRYDFVLCCGDDYTDEDMFGALENVPYATTIKVGLGETRAKSQVLDTEDIMSLLRRLDANIRISPGAGT